MRLFLPGHELRFSFNFSDLNNADSCGLLCKKMMKGMKDFEPRRLTNEHFWFSESYF